MKYKFKEFKKTDEKTIEENFQLLIEHYNNALKDLRVGQDRSSTFNDQFDSFSAKVTINARTEGEVVNELSTIPTEWMVIDAKDANIGDLSRGTTKWNENKLYLFNSSVIDATFKIRFFAGEQGVQGLTASTSPFPNRHDEDVATFTVAANGALTTRVRATLDSLDFNPGGGFVFDDGNDQWTFPSTGAYGVMLGVNGYTASAETSLSVFIEDDTTSTDVYTFDNFGMANGVFGSDYLYGQFSVTSITDNYQLEWSAGSSVAIAGNGQLFLWKM